MKLLVTGAAGFIGSHFVDLTLQAHPEDQVIGLDKLKALHLNDSKNPFASHKDRHACIGQGSLGVDTFRLICRHPALADKPMILETPNELPGYQAEIQLLRSL